MFARRRRPTVVAVTGVVAMAMALFAACGGSDDGRDNGDASLTVFAASSLTDAFTEIGESYEETHPGTDIDFNFAGSSELASQVVEGAPADVFVAADIVTMDRAVDASAVDGEPAVFATNRSQLIVAPGNPEDISALDDLTRDDLVVVVCAPEVPCGNYAAQIFANAGVDVVPDSYERNVKSVVTKVMLGEADAGIAYVTDVVAAGDRATGVDVPDDDNVTAEYPIAVTTESTAPDVARSFVDFVLGAEGQRVLSSFGFGTP